MPRCGGTVQYSLATYKIIIKNIAITQILVTPFDIVLFVIEITTYPICKNSQAYESKYMVKGFERIHFISKRGRVCMLKRSTRYRQTTSRLAFDAYEEK